MHHVVQSFATTALIQLVGLANAVLLARILGPEGAANWRWSCFIRCWHWG